MRKSAPVAFLLAWFLVLGGLLTSTPAYAEDDEDEAETSEVVESPQGPQPLKLRHKEGDEKRKELEEKYGKRGKLAVPPLVIRPQRDTDDLEGEEGGEVEEDEQEGSIGFQAPDAPVNGAGAKVSGGQPSGEVSGTLSKASTSFIAINPMTAAEGNAGGTGRAVNPQQNIPIDISQVRFNRKSPAEVFIQASQVGLYAMAAGAIILGLFTASRAIRRK
ncbi:MAG: hypothetical protein RLY34_259 [Actinomycetota bacterium]|jgi:hypothetical protein